VLTPRRSQVRLVSPTFTGCRSSQGGARRCKICGFDSEASPLCRSLLSNAAWYCTGFCNFFYQLRLPLLQSVRPSLASRVSRQRFLNYLGLQRRVVLGLADLVTHAAISEKSCEALGVCRTNSVVKISKPLRLDVLTAGPDLIEQIETYRHRFGGYPESVLDRFIRVRTLGWEPTIARLPSDSFACDERSLPLARG